MPGFRFNHMEITVPEGALTRDRAAIRKFYGEVFGMEALDVPILGQTGLLLRTDPETSQFILVTEQKEHLQSPGYDHLGFLFETLLFQLLREKARVLNLDRRDVSEHRQNFEILAAKTSRVQP